VKKPKDITKGEKEGKVSIPICALQAEDDMTQNRFLLPEVKAMPGK